MKLLERLNIQHISDLLFHLPLRYEDRTRIYPLNKIKPGMHVLVEGTLISAKIILSKRPTLLCRLEDDYGFINLRFFHFNRYQKNTLMQTNLKLRCFGEVRLNYSGGLEFIHPEYRLMEQASELLDQTLRPVYPTTKGLTQTNIRKLIKKAFLFAEENNTLTEILPHPPFAISLLEALRYIHEPPINANLKIAQKRLAFEELVAFQVGLKSSRQAIQKNEAIAFPSHDDNDLQAKLLAQLAFRLTEAQAQVLKEINHDLSLSFPMQRLLQGDVGSGKTIVALLAMLRVAQAHHQSVLMVPTEILAEQHYQFIKTCLKPLNINVGLILGSSGLKLKKLELIKIEEGYYSIVVGTHALFQEMVKFKNLSFIVIDEQHRFGVQQRLALKNKGMNIYHPHQLIMTATPIPRTLTMTSYADLDISIINELPPGRKPIATKIISNLKRDEVIEWSRKHCQSGQQVYWVCTLIEDSEILQAKAAKKIQEELRIKLPELNIGLIYSNLIATEKENIMALFKAGKINILVATTVIEVGVDIANATLIIIENAERLGLSQLHQLRGRVGRSQLKSYCFLLYQNPLSYIARQRLHIIKKYQDGFKIAEEDLNLRGPGEILGTRQKGLLKLKIADILRDADMIPRVNEVSDFILSKQPELIALLIKRWLRGSDEYAGV